MHQHISEGAFKEGIAHPTRLVETTSTWPQAIFKVSNSILGSQPGAWGVSVGSEMEEFRDQCFGGCPGFQEPDARLASCWVECKDDVFQPCT